MRTLGPNREFEDEPAHRSRRRKTPAPEEKTADAIEPQRVAGNLALQNRMKPRAGQVALPVGHPADSSEQEAEHISQEMTATLDSPAIAQRETDQQGTEGTKGSAGDSRSLPARVREFFEARFGTALNNVRLHTGSEAAASARSLEARAFTVGDDVVFGEGEYDPGSSEGRKLIAHEVTHVVQQRTRGAGRSVQRKPLPGASATPATATPATATPVPDSAPSADPNAAPAPAPAVPATPVATAGAKGILDGETITTYADAAAFCRTRAAALGEERATILGEGVPAPASLFNVMDRGLQLAKTAEPGGSAEIDDVTYEQADAWFSAYSAAMSEGEHARALAAAGKLKQLQAIAERGRADNERTAATVADRQREAYANPDDTMLSWLGMWSTNLYDSALDLAAVSGEAREVEASLLTSARAAAAQAGPNVGKVSAGYKLPDSGTLQPLLQKVNIALNAIQLVQASADMVATGTSGGAEDRTKVAPAVDMASSLETIGGSFVTTAGGLGIYLNLYIQPMTRMCLKALSKLESVARRGNQAAIERGDYDLVNWSLEPGGRRLFDFMRTVMSASSPAEVPTPVPPEIDKYFVANRDDISAGASGKKDGEKKDGDELPTTGFWFWRKVDQDKIAKWVFDHRRNLWAIFYGSAVPGANA